MLSAFVELELVRFFRRRGTFWLFALTGLVFAGVSAMPWIAVHSGIPRFYAIRTWMLLPEVSHHVMVGLTLVVVGIYTHFAAGSLLRQELEVGAWVLVEQCPAPVARILLARGAGIALSALALQAFLGLFVLGHEGFVARAPFLGVAELGGIWLLAALAIPGAFLAATMRHQGGTRGRLAAILRTLVAGPPAILLLHYCIRADLRAEQRGLGSVIEAMFTHQTGVALDSPLDYYAHPAVPYLIVFGTAFAYAALSWRQLVRRLGRTSEQ